jgi:hypothetical protein
MAKSTNPPKPTQPGTNKGDGGRRPPSNPPPIQQPGKSRSNEGAPGIKPPRNS